MNLYDRKLAELGLEFEPKGCYEQLLTLSERLIEGEVEHQWFEEAVRQAYRNRAYKLIYRQSCSKSDKTHLPVDIEQKTSDTLVLFQKDRTQPFSSTKSQILYRMEVKLVIGPDESLFRIDWDNERKEIGFQYLGAYDLTLGEIKKAEEKWNYYLISYMMRVPTEGVPLNEIKAPFLYRSIEETVQEAYPIEVIDQGLMARICMNTYKLFFENDTLDYFIRSYKKDGDENEMDKNRTENVLQKRKDQFNELWNGGEGWKSDMGDRQVKNALERYKVWIEQGPEALAQFKPEEPEEKEEEEEEEAEEEEEDGEKWRWRKKKKKLMLRIILSRCRMKRIRRKKK